MVYERQVMGDGANGSFEKRVKRDERRLSDLVALWFSLHGQGLKSGDQVRRALENMVTSMGDPYACNFSANTFADYRADRLAGLCAKADPRKTVVGKSVTVSTTNHELAYLMAMFNELERLGQWAVPNPLQKVRALKYDETEMGYLSSLQIQQLLAHLDRIHSDVGLMVRVCLATGARWSEATSLRPNQVRDGRIFFIKTKTSKNRAVPVTDGLVTMLERRLPWATTYKEAYREFRKAIVELGIVLPKGQLTHVLRHMFASHYMMNGGDILTLQRVLGHASLMMTMRYAHFSPGHLAEVISLNPLAVDRGHFVDDSKWLAPRKTPREVRVMH